MLNLLSLSDVKNEYFEKLLELNASVFLTIFSFF